MYLSPVIHVPVPRHNHSDYLLKRLNQLLRLHDLKKDQPDRFDKYCKDFEHTRSLTLDRGNIKAYYFHFSEKEKKVLIDLQDLQEGIPFDSFSNVIDKEIAFDDYWEGENADL